MAITAKDVEILHRYAEGVMSRADHHAGEVKAIALALLGGIIWRGEPGSIEIKQYAGNPANVLWVAISGKRYAFVYNHVSKEIEMKDRSYKGPTLHGFTNSTPITDVEKVFRSL